MQYIPCPSLPQRRVGQSHHGIYTGDSGGAVSWLLLKERIGAPVWLALACSAAGIGLLSLSKQELVAHIPPGQSADFSHKQALWGNLPVFYALAALVEAGRG